MENIFDSYCGIKCSECEFVEKCGCKGCIASKGEPFYGGKCEIAKCVENKGPRFCGECADFPCELLNRFAFDKEHGDNGERIENCKRQKAQLVSDARKGVDPVAPCGFHCDHCFLGQWCGSCRSDYNCCSFATICEGKICPNVKCANEKGLDGCYDCDELSDCTKGFYSVENEYMAKASALFICKYSKAVYTKMLENASEKDVYPKAFTELKSVEAVLSLLEEYIVE